VLWPLGHADLAGQARMMGEIGDAVGHSRSTLHLAPDDGAPLHYYGELCGWQWPTRAYMRARRLRGQRVLETEAKFRELVGRYAPEFFIVTDLDEYNAQPELRRLLTAGFPVLAETGEYVIFDLRRSTHAE
jgi:hypothetical protein